MTRFTVYVDLHPRHVTPQWGDGATLPHYHAVHRDHVLSYVNVNVCVCVKTLLLLNQVKAKAKTWLNEHDPGRANAKQSIEYAHCFNFERHCRLFQDGCE